MLFGKSFSGDRLFFLIVIILAVLGVAMFFSASLGLLARSTDVSLLHSALTQIVLGLVPGAIGLVMLRFAPQKWIERAAPFVYGGAMLLTLLVFIPGVGSHANGAARWIDLGFTTIQPAEFLKIGIVMMAAWYLSRMRGKLRDPRTGLLPFSLIVGVPFAILLVQPNTSTVLVTGLTCAALYALAGAPLRDFAVLGLAAVLILGTLVFMRPYLMSRVLTFIDPSRDSLGSGYQIQQSLIAIGSGGMVGRGFGQSVEKFNYLPEPDGDSVFAVYGEEFGFIGTVFLVLLFAGFAARGFAIASDAATTFGSLLATGLTLLITLSAFLNIGAMLAVLPLTGLPLPFVSHGGTALLASLASVGLILNVAAHRKAQPGRRIG